MFASPQLRATRLIPAVVPDVKMTSRAFPGSDECPRFLARFLVLLRASLAERVDAAVDVGVVPLVHAAKHLDHLPRSLRAGRVIQKYQRPVAMYHLLEDGEILAQRPTARASTDQRLYVALS